MAAHPMLLCLDEGRRFDTASPSGRCPSCGGPLVSEGAVLKRLTEPELPPDVKLASSVFGDFILIAKIGEGGSGTVHKAWQKSLRRYVAIKFLTADSPKLVSRFLRETRLAAALRHPNIVPVHQVDTIDGRLCLVMDFIDGATLDEARLDVRRTMELMRDAANAVGFAHQAGVIHRDVKPRNLLVDRAGKIWVVDFGLARLLTSGGTLTKTGDVMGSPCYMSPEQAGGGRGDARTDLYGLGAAFYHALTGRPPYDGDTAGVVLARVINGNLVPPRAVNPRIETAAETILLTCLAKEPRHRYADARALVDDIECYLAGEPIGATRPGLPSRGWRALRRHPIAVAAIVVFVVVSTAAVVLLRQSRDLQSAETTNARLEARARRTGTMLDRLRMAEELSLRGDTTPAALRGAADAVILDADGLLADAPRDAAVHVARGRAWKLLGNLLRAERDFTEAAALDDQNGSASFELGLIYLDHLQDSYIGFDSRRIVSEFQASANDWTARATAAFRRAAKAGSILESERAAADLWARAISNEAGAAAVECRRRVALGGRVEEFLHLLSWCAHDPQEKLRHLTEAVQRAPNNPRYRFARATVRVELGDLRGAVEDCSRAIDFRPDFAVAWNNRGQAREQLHELADALTDLSKAIELRPDFAYPRVTRADVKRQLGDQRGALEDLDKAILIEPAIGDFYVRRGVAREALKDLGGAYEDYSKAIELQPKDATAWLDRGSLREAKGDLEGAIKDMMRAVELRPTFAEAHYNLGNFHGKQGETAAAILDYTRAIDLKPGFMSAYLNRGMALAHTGRFEEAIRDYTKAIELDNRHVGVRVNRGLASAALAERSTEGRRELLLAALDDYDAALRLAAADWSDRRLVEQWRTNAVEALRRLK